MTKFLNISTDNTLGGASPSDETVSSQKAIKEYVDSHSGSGAVDSVNGQTGTVVLTASDVGAQPSGSYLTTNTTQSIDQSATKTFNGRVNFYGTGDSNAIYLSTDTRIDVKNTSYTVLGFANGTFLINHNNYGLMLRGSGDRPNYKNSTTYLALLSDVPTDTGDLTNGAGFITSSALSGYATETWVGNQGYITGIDSSDVTTALGYTPYDASNPNGYTSNTGTVTSVNNVSPVNGNVSLSIPTVNDSTITIQKNGTTVDSFTTNASSGKTINITVPTTASDVGALPDTTVIPTVNNPTITITQGGVTKGSFTLNQSSGDTIALDAGGGGGSYTAGDGIDITSNVISNTGVRSVSTGTNNGTISVDTNGTSAEVSVAGLGSAAFKSMTSTYDSTGTDPVDGVAVASAISDRADTSLSNLSSDGEKWVARVGMMIPYGGSTAPSGWLLCDGSNVSRTTYASLFAVIGTTYGEGNGSTTFTLPNINNIVKNVNTTVSIKGTGKTLGLTNGNSNYGLRCGGSGYQISQTGLFNVNVGTASSGSNVTGTKGVGVVEDTSKSGLTGSLSRTNFSCKFIIKF